MTKQEIAFLLVRNGIAKKTLSSDDYVEANEDEFIRALGNATIANSLEFLGERGLVADVQPAFGSYGAGFAYRINSQIAHELSSDELIARHVESLFELPPTETSETIARLIEICEQAKAKIRYSEDLISTLKELKSCFSFDCYIACMALSGKVLEMCFKQLMTDEGIEYREKAMLGELTKKLEEHQRGSPQRYFDESLFGAATIISRSRNGAIHSSEKIPVPSREQTIMVIHAVADTVNRIIVNPPQ